MLKTHRTEWRDPGEVFSTLFAESRTAFWLDSARPGPGARFTFMGDASGPLAASVTYDVTEQQLTIERGGEQEQRSEPILEYLERATNSLPHDPDLPFDFQGGPAGYLGYELKADCGSPNTHSSPHPDAAFIFADRLLVFDHDEGHLYLLALCQPGEDATVETWFSSVSARFRESGEGSAEPPRCCSDESSPDSPQPHRSHAEYLSAIEQCLELLRAGESYEICLTNELAIETETDPLSLYMELRRVNPAPFASYLRFGDLTVLSSSPERFLKVDTEGTAESKPIKGTARRDPDPAKDAALATHLAGDEKTRAENLMIVDLLRNDLGSVCAIGSVEVPALMEVESYATVHQLVSTVRGRLRAGASTLDCVRACFPPGSMTGAPKRRTMEILDRLERRPRGVYSGVIGWFGAAGACELSVTIRTIVLAGDRAAVGAGGAIVLGSDPEREHREMLLKAAAPLRALGPGVDPASEAGPGPAPISLDVPRRAAPAPPPASAHDLKS